MHAKLTIVRHGQSEWNLANRFTGWSMLVHARTTDVSLSTVRAVAQKSFEPDGYVCLRVCVYAVDVDLTERGITEAREAGRLLAADGQQHDLVCTSTLRRAIRTACLVLSGTNQCWVPLLKDVRLNEQVCTGDPSA